MLNNSTPVRFLLFFLGCALFWQGCNIINPAEPTPTYIHIDSFSFQSNGNSATEISGAGSEVINLSHNITSAWVYYNGNRIGIFDLPATFPVIANGTGQIQVTPGIALDGLNINVAPYPFYEPDTFNLTAQPGKVINHTPKTNFYSGAKVMVIDYFHGKTEFRQSAGNRGLTYTTDDSLLYPGTQSGYGVGEIKLLAVGDSSIDSLKDVFSIPEGTAFIEFSYKSTIPFYVGLQASYSKTISLTPYYLSGVNPSNDWQKFYLQVDGYTAMAEGGSYDPNMRYNFYIKAVLGDGQTSGRLLISNIHLVSF